MAKLSATKVEKTKRLGRHSDGSSLYLLVRKQGETLTKSWVFRWRDRNTRKLRDMGLGSIPPVSLKSARKAAETARELVQAGKDPKAERDRERLSRAAQAANAVTFADCVERYVDAHAPGWKSAKHAAQWRSTLTDIAGPLLGHLPVSEIDTELVMRCLGPNWETRTETASRLRGRIESVLDWAKVQGYRSGENPARWRGHLDKLLPRPTKVKRVRHHTALPYSEMDAFMRELAKQQGVAARCLEFSILTAARTSEAIGARWNEIDLDAGVWTVPAGRIKAGREHRVPLSPAAVAVLKAQQGHDETYVFPGIRADKPLSNMAMLELLKGMKKGFTVHGFRSSFRDWAADCTAYPREIAEAALAHALQDKTEAAYRRSDLFEKRRKLMTAWAKHCHTKVTGEVVPIRKRS